MTAIAIEHVWIAASHNGVLRTSRIEDLRLSWTCFRKVSKSTIVWLFVSGSNISIKTFIFFICAEEGRILFEQPGKRGGGEFGDAWRDAGIKLNRQNAINDYIEAVEYLVDKKYTSTEEFAEQIP